MKKLSIKLKAINFEARLRAKEITRIAPKVEQSKKAYKRKGKHRNQDVYPKLDKLSTTVQLY